MRIRTVKPDFWTHEIMAGLPEFTRLLALALLNYADDEGYFMASEKLIQGTLFPFLDDSKKIPRAIQELSRMGYLQLGFFQDGRKAGRIVNFTKHQRVDKPKTSSIKACMIIQDESEKNLGCFNDASQEEWKGMEEEVEHGKDLSCPLADLPECLLIWSKAPAIGKQRSSKKQLAQQWKKIKHKPSIETLADALSAWTESQKWKDGYCEGIHIWVTNEQWDNLPEKATSSRTLSRDDRHPGELKEETDLSTLPVWDATKDK